MQHIPTTAKHTISHPKSQDLATPQSFPNLYHLSIPPAAWETQGTAMQISKALFLKAEADHRDT